MEFTDERLVPSCYDSDRDLYYWHLARYHFAKSYINKNDSVLDVACGSGYGTYELGSIAASVIGVDIDPEAVDFCAGNFGAQNIKYVQSNCLGIGKVASHVDVCTSFETIEHLTKPDQADFIKAVREVLTENGLFIVSTPNKAIYNSGDEIENNKFHLHEMTLPEFRALLEQHFECVYIFGQRPAKPSKVKQPLYGLMQFLLGLKSGSFRWTSNNYLQLSDFEFSTIQIEKCLMHVAVCRSPKKERGNR